MNIDVHNHFLPEPILELVQQEPAYEINISKAGVTGGPLTQHELFPSLHDPAAKLEELASRGIDGAVMSLPPRALAYNLSLELGERMSEAANRGMREFCAHAPDRLHWMAHVPLQDPVRSAEILEQAAADGAAGVGVGSSVAGRPLDEPELEPFWEAVDRAGLPVFIHTAYNAKIPALQSYYLTNVIGNLLETTICAERLVCSGILDRHPNVTLVLAHAGGYFPFQAGRLKHARTVRAELADAPVDPWAYVGRLIFDTVTHDIAALQYLVSRVGAENVVLGSDVPYDMSTPRPVDDLRAAVDADTATLIAQENPARIFGLGA